MRGDSRRGPTGTRRQWPSSEDQACSGARAGRSGAAAVVMEPRRPPCRTSPRRMCSSPGTGGAPSVATLSASLPGSAIPGGACSAVTLAAHAASAAPATVSLSLRPSLPVSAASATSTASPAKAAPAHRVELASPTATAASAATTVPPV